MVTFGYTILFWLQLVTKMVTNGYIIGSGYSWLQKWLQMVTSLIPVTIGYKNGYIIDSGYNWLQKWLQMVTSLILFTKMVTNDDSILIIINWDGIWHHVSE